MYIVTEIQTNANGTVGLLNWTFDNRNAAESQYHTVLAAAAISALPKHACIMFSEEGFPLMNACYTHDAARAPEPEPETEE